MTRQGGPRGPRRGHGEPTWRRGSLRIYRALLWLYPPSLRRAYGDAMLQLFRDSLRDEIARRGPPGALHAWAAALADLAASLPREWPRELRRPHVQAERIVVTHRTGATITGYTVMGRIGEPRRRIMHHDKFEKFTERARKVLSLAQEEAQRFNHNYIGTEHILLGLVREGDGVAAKVLSNLGVELNAVRAAVEHIIGKGDRIVLGEVGLTPRAKKVVELAVDEARRLNHHYIGTEHLLLGLIREGEGIAAGVLESLGVNLEKVRATTIDVLSQGGPGFASRQEERSFTGESRPRPDFGRFTERARLAIRTAIVEAREREQSEVNTGHMLIALFQEDESLAALALQQSGVNLDAAQRGVEQGIGARKPAGEQSAKSPVGLDAHMLRMIALAADEARQMGDLYVGTEHLLLGLIREGDGLGAQALLTLGANLSQLRSISMKLRTQPVSARDKRPAVGQITLSCRDVAVTSSFYIQNFGAEPVTDVALAGASPSLRLPGGGPLLALRAAPADAAPVGDSIELNLLVGDVDLVWRTLKDSAVAGLSAVSDSPHGRVFSMPDPDGRLLHVYAHGQ